MLNQSRLERVLNNSEVDQLLITDRYAIYYLVGRWFFPGERFLGLFISKEKKPVLYVNELFRFEEDLGLEVRIIKDTDPIQDIVKNEVNNKKALGVDKNLQARFLLPLMDNNVATHFVNGSIPVDHTRAIKDSEEIAFMKESSHINDLAMAEFKKLPKTGITEIEIANQMLDIYKSLGAESYSFEPIVAFGVNAADPHHGPDETVLHEGEVVLFDVGCTYKDYCSDMTRTFFFKGTPNETQKRVYDLVRKANETAEEYVKPGVRLCDIDSKARDVITEGGYGKDFTHRLGHFIGIEDHEYGDVSQAFTNLTEVGNIFSIEPGIYNKQDMGCRIEDLILVTEDGHEVLNKYPHDFEIIE